jgi:hypothetical protein
MLQRVLDCERWIVKQESAGGDPQGKDCTEGHSYLAEGYCCLLPAAARRLSLASKYGAWVLRGR